MQANPSRSRPAQAIATDAPEEEAQRVRPAVGPERPLHEIHSDAFRVGEYFAGADEPEGGAVAAGGAGGDVVQVGGVIIYGL
jgi:hypothetical protein